MIQDPENIYQEYKMKRVEEREWIVKLLFQHDFNKIDLDNIDSILEHNNLSKSIFIRESLESIIRNIDKIDNYISKYVDDNRLKNILPIERAILRVSINEFVIMKNVPVSVSINEAVKISKKYSNENSYIFINGVLSSIAKSLEKQNE